MVCPMHNDHDPSLGIIDTGDSELVHCFGCNYWADVVKLHKDISKKYYGKRLSDVEAKRDLCRLFGVDYSIIEEQESEEKKSSDSRRFSLMDEKVDKFDESDFRYLVLDGKLKKKPIGYFNALMLSMIYEQKQRGD